MKTDSFDLLFLFCFVLIMVVRSIGVYYSRRESGTLHQVKLPPVNMDLVMELIQSIGLFILPVLYLFTDWIDFFNYVLPAYIAWPGLFIALISIAMLGKTHLDLGGGWSDQLQVRAGQKLITTGIYQRVRHPMYLAHLLYAIAQAMMLQNWLAGFSFLILQLPFYFIRIPREERMMLDSYGEEYRAYMNRTGSLFPRIRRLG